MFKPCPHIRKVRKHGHYTGWFYDSCWRANIYLLYPVTPAMLRAAIKREFDMEYRISDDEDFGGRCIHLIEDKTGKEADIIALKEWDGTAYDHGALAHEAFHCTAHILQLRGVPLLESTMETYAYLLEMVVDKCLQIITNKPR